EGLDAADGDAVVLVLARILDDECLRIRVSYIIVVHVLVRDQDDIVLDARRFQPDFLAKWVNQNRAFFGLNTETGLPKPRDRHVPKLYQFLILKSTLNRFAIRPSRHG